MKRTLATVLFLAMMSVMLLLSGCTGTTPDDAAEAETAITLDEMKWSFTVEIDGGETTTYTYEDALKHELTKTYCSYRYAYSGSGSNPQVTTSIFEGCKVSEFLADVGCQDATKIEIYHTNTKYYSEPFVFEPEVFNSEGSVICWIQNKKDVISNSESHVGFASSEGGVNDMCTSVAKIVIYK